jgi:cyclopropane fatty-acyl-phospholipid synthase-like methyltransferase
MVFRYGNTKGDTRVIREMLSVLRIAKVLGWRAILKSYQIRRMSNITLRGFYATRVIIALLNIQLFDELVKCKRVNLERFAARENLDLKMLQILCEYLFELKILRREGTEYALDADGELIAKSMDGVYYLVHAYEDVIHHLESLLRKEMTYGLDVQRRADLVAQGSGSVGQLLAFPMMYEEIRRNRFRHVLDLGCGDGSFLIGLCQSNAGVRGYGVDIAPEAIALGKQRVAEANLADRVQLFVGDILDLDAVANQWSTVDVATAVYVIHEFQNGIVDLLKRFRAILPGVPLMICEVIRHSPEELRKKPGGIMEIQLFHELSHQRLFTREEWHSMFEQAGYTSIQENYLAFMRTCIYTVS